MNEVTHSDYIRLSNILSKLETKIDHLDRRDLDTFINKIGRNLVNITEHSRSGQISSLQGREISTLLLKIANIISPYQQHDYAINALVQNIMFVRTSLEPPPTEDQKNKIELKIGFYCDIDNPDHNGAIATDLIASIKDRQPFITTRSLIQGINISDEVKRGQHGEESINNTKFNVSCAVQTALLETCDDWEVFQQFDEEHGEELFVFLPKSLKPDYSDLAKLSALDFATDGTLQKVPLSKVLERPMGKGEMKAFFRLFSPTPQIKKLFFTTGHGDKDIIAGIRDSTYKEYLDFLEQQKCQGLVISSCYSGGETSIKSLSQEESSDVPSLDENTSGHSFLTLVRSIGDFPTFSEQEAEQNIGEFYDKMGAFLESDRPRTISQVRRVLDEVEEGKNKKIANFSKVYFPHARGSPGGFRPIGEQGKGFSLTFHLLRTHALEAKKIHGMSTTETEPSIAIKIKDVIEVHPESVDLPLSIEGEPPVLLSMVPGNGHHLIHSIALNEGSPEALISKTLNFHEKYSSSVNKGFFISKLSTPHRELHDVALLMTPNYSYYLYREGDTFFLNNGITTRPITGFQRDLIMNSILQLTLPSDLAVRASSGGQESERDFLERMTQAFPPISTEIYRVISLISVGAPTQSYNELNLSPEEKESLVFFLFSTGQHRQATDIFLQERMNPNMSDLMGKPITAYAITAGLDAFFDFLLGHGASPNALDPTSGLPLLHQTILENKRLQYDSLLSHRDLDIDIKDKKGFSALMYASENVDYIRALNARNCDIDIIQEDTIELSATPKKTALTWMIVLEERQSIDNLLIFGANPNIGTPSALTLALHKNDKALVKRLLRAGGKPFEAGDYGVVPFIEALKWSSPDIVELLLKRRDAYLSLIDSAGVSIHFAALFSGNPKIIRKIKQLQIPFPRVLSAANQKILNIYLLRCLTTGHEDAIKSLLSWADTDAVLYAIGVFLLNHRQDLLAKYINSGLINPYVQSSQGEFLFDAIVKKLET